MKKNINFKYIATIVAVVLVLLLSYSVYLVFDLHDTVYKPILDKYGDNDDIDGKEGNMTPNGEENITNDHILNVLLIGVDSEDASAGSYVGRSDTIMIVRYNKESKEVGIVSVPRDTRVSLPGRGYEKINHAYAYGGVSYLRKTLEDFLGIKIHNYVMVDFIGFKNVVDILGGVEMNIEKDMYYYDDALDEVIVDLEEGKQLLDGEQALGYVRWRGGADADIGRVKRQQEFLKEMMDEVFKFGSVLKLRQLAGEVSSNVVMDFGMRKIISLIPSIYKIDRDNMATEVLEGNNRRIGGIWYYEVDQEKAREKINTIID